MVIAKDAVVQSCDMRFLNSQVLRVAVEREVDRSIGGVELRADQVSDCNKVGKLGFFNRQIFECEGGRLQVLQIQEAAQKDGEVPREFEKLLA